MNERELHLVFTGQGMAVNDLSVRGHSRSYPLILCTGHLSQTKKSESGIPRNKTDETLFLTLSFSTNSRSRPTPNPCVLHQNGRPRTLSTRPAAAQLLQLLVSISKSIQSLFLNFSLFFSPSSSLFCCCC